MEYQRAYEIAVGVVAQLEPHCRRIAIAGSLRRKRPEVGDIEIVAIPEPYEVGLLACGITPVVEQWAKVKGELPCRYTQRILPEGIKLDLFLAHELNWGLIYAIRTGSAEFSHRVLAAGWVKQGLRGVDGMLEDKQGLRYPCRQETDLFKLAGVPWVDPEDREPGTEAWDELTGWT